MLRDRSREYRLLEGDDGLLLQPVSVHVFRRFNRERQPGEPEESVFEFESPEGDGTAGFILTAEGGPVSGIEVALGNNPRFAPDYRLPEGWSMLYRGGEEVEIHDATWHQQDLLPIDPVALHRSPGSHVITLRANQVGDEEAAARLEIRIQGLPQPVSR